MNNFKRLIEKASKGYEPGVKCPKCKSGAVYNYKEYYVCSNCNNQWKIKDHKK